MRTRITIKTLPHTYAVVYHADRLYMEWPIENMIYN